MSLRLNFIDIIFSPLKKWKQINREYAEFTLTMIIFWNK